MERAGNFLNETSDSGFAAGTQLGPYQLVGPLGVGGMGRVYLANDTRLARRPVAVKEMVVGEGLQEKKAVEDFAAMGECPRLAPRTRGDLGQPARCARPRALQPGTLEP